MAKIGKVWLQYICFLVLVTPSYLFAGIITGELDRSSGTVDDQFVYTLSIQGSFSGDPSFPAIEGVEGRSYGRSQSVSIVNGKMTSETQFQFVLTANKAGQYTIPPIKMLVDNKSIETLPLEMKVEQAGKGSSKAGGNNGSAQAGAGIQLERSFSKTRVYVGEPVLVKIRLLVPARTKLVGAEPNFKYPSALQIKPNDKQKNYTEEIGGESYSVTELEAMLTPTREGDFAIDPATIDMRIAVPRRSLSRSPWDSLFNDTEVRQGRLRSPPATLKVLPLPTEGRRRDFSGLIGEFQLSGELSARTANPGDN